MPVRQPCDLSPDVRLHEVAALLARAVLRAKKPTAPQIPPDFPDPRLELPPETRLSVSTRGFTPREKGDHA